jgi:hypothetical protein
VALMWTSRATLPNRLRLSRLMPELNFIPNKPDE